MSDVKIAPVQGYSAGIPWAMHLRAYDAYCKKYGPQPAMIDLEGRGCRGGFSTGELDMFIPGWREELSELARLRIALAEALTSRLTTVNENARLRTALAEATQLSVKAERADADLAAAREVLADLLNTLPPFFHTEEMNAASDAARAFLERTALQGQRRTEGTCDYVAKAIDYLVPMARAVSNIRKPWSDNIYGRAATALAWCLSHDDPRHALNGGIWNGEDKPTPPAAAGEGAEG